MISSIRKTLKQIKPLYKAYKFLVREHIDVHSDRLIPDMFIKRNDILRIANKYRNATTFIETGTFFGDTIEFFKNKFVKLYSIELSQDLADKAIKRFSADDNIKVVQGNSADQLGNILSEVKTPCIFWLDGHYSTDFWVGNEYIITARGKKITPILEELAHIANHYLIDNHVILIDDARLFIGKHDYPSMAKLKRFISKKLPLHSLEIRNDIINILPK